MAKRWADLGDEISASHLRSRTLFLTGEIDSEEADAFTKMLLYLRRQSRKPVRVVMNSEGGDVFSGLMIYTAIREAVAAGVAVNVQVYGLCASMATVILQAASRRMATKHARFLVHEVRDFKIFEEETATEAYEQAAELRKVNQQLAEILAQRTGKPLKDILALIRKTDAWFSAGEAKNFGLVDCVI